MTGHWYGSPPTRDEVLAEIARELSDRRNRLPEWAAIRNITPREAEVRIDRLQAAYDWIMEHWPRGKATA